MLQLWPVTFCFTASFVTVLIVKLTKSFRRSGHSRRLPGPKGLPLLGNLYDLPKPGEIEAYHWANHKDLYGPISSVTVTGQTMVIINDAQIAIDLLEKRSSNYSARPRRVFAGEMLGWEHSLGLLPYDQRFRSTRKVMGREIGSRSTAAEYNKAQEIEAAHFMLRLLDEPKGLMKHIKKGAGSLALRILYGYIAEPFKEDPLIELVEEAMEIFAQTTVPGAFLVDLLPFLRWIPAWVPGMSFQKLAQKWHPLMTDMNLRPYNFVKHQIDQGTAEDSFLSRLIRAGEPNPAATSINQWSASALFGGAGDTIVGSIQCFFLAMTRYPLVQRRAQQEIDAITGRSRLPTLSDRAKMPYIEALLQEVLRWHPISPIPLAHVSEEDDTYRGYHIPKGAMMLANVWLFTHDPQTYHDPMNFKPERYLSNEGRKPEPDPRKFVFGFGRRVCPGRLLGENALYINIVQTLAAFDISATPVDDAMESTSFRFTPGTISRPEPFECVIQPRSKQHEHLVRSLEESFPWEESHGKVLEQMAAQSN